MFHETSNKITYDIMLKKNIYVYIWIEVYEFTINDVFWIYMYQIIFSSNVLKFTYLPIDLLIIINILNYILYQKCIINKINYTYNITTTWVFFPTHLIMNLLPIIGQKSCELKSNYSYMLITYTHIHVLYNHNLYWYYWLWFTTFIWICNYELTNGKITPEAHIYTFSNYHYIFIAHLSMFSSQLTVIVHNNLTSIIVFSSWKQHLRPILMQMW